MSSIRIYVNKKHINEGERYAQCSCPIALALKDNGYKNVNVNKHRIRCLDNNDNFIYFTLSPKGIKFIDEFDHRFPVKPCHITIKPIEQLLGAKS